MKKINFTLEGQIEVPNNISKDKVEKAINFLLGLTNKDKAEDIPNIDFLAYVSKNTTYYKVKVHN